MGFYVRMRVACGGGDTVKEAPKRRNQLALELQADSWKDILSTMRHILFALESEPENELRTISSGGYNSGYTLQSTVDEEMTHDIFVENLEQWIQERRANP